MEKFDILHMPVPKLRDEVKKIGGYDSVVSMNKEQLVEAMFKHHNIPLEEALDVHKDPEIKKGIRAVQADWKKAIEAGDKKRAAIYRRRVHNLKRTTRSWTKAKMRAKALAKHG
ncbi:MAG: hypothetical protein M5R36_12410 [Deltaproteobacteria bacterium]|nr:hypothetical protein [Deltaproteobacteria bacterium]